MNVNEIWVDQFANNEPSLADALAEVGPSPCEEFECSNYQRCANEGLACRAFQNYVNGKYNHPNLIGEFMQNPNEKIYIRLFPEPHDL